jgi:hypothetical protein
MCFFTLIIHISISIVDTVSRAAVWRCVLQILRAERVAQRLIWRLMAAGHRRSKSSSPRNLHVPAMEPLVSAPKLVHLLTTVLMKVRWR